MDVVKLRQLVFELENDPGTATQKVQAMSKSQQQAVLNFLKNFGSDRLISQLLSLFMKYKIILNDAPQRQANSMRLLYLRDHEYEWYLTFEQLHKIMAGQTRATVVAKQGMPLDRPSQTRQAQEMQNDECERTGSATSPTAQNTKPTEKCAN